MTKKKEFQLSLKLGKFTLTALAIIVIFGIAVSAFYYVGKQGGIASGDTVAAKYTMLSAKNNSPLSEELQVKFKVGNNEIMPAFEKNVLGMKAGGEKKFTLKAEDAFGKYDIGNVETTPKFTEIERTFQISLAELSTSVSSQYKIQKGQTIRSSYFPWPVKVKEIKGTDVILEHMPVLNSLYTDPLILPWPIKVIKITTAAITYEHMPKIGTITLSAENKPGRVVEVRDNDLIVDFNHPLAGQDIVFDVTIISVEKNTA